MYYFVTHTTVTFLKKIQIKYFKQNLQCTSPTVKTIFFSGKM